MEIVLIPLAVSSRGGLEVERLLHIQLKVVIYASVDQILLGDVYMVKILTKIKELWTRHMNCDIHVGSGVRKVENIFRDKQVLILP